MIIWKIWKSDDGVDGDDGDDNNDDDDDDIASNFTITHSTFCASTASFIIHHLSSSFIIRHFHTVDGCEIHQLRYSRWFIPCLSHYWWGFNHYYHSFLFTIITINYHYSLVDGWFIPLSIGFQHVSTIQNWWWRPWPRRKDVEAPGESQ